MATWERRQLVFQALRNRFLRTQGWIRICNGSVGPDGLVLAIHQYPQANVLRRVAVLTCDLGTEVNVGLRLEYPVRR